MKNRSMYYLFAALLLLGTACRNTSPEQQIAEEFCECFRPMTELYQQVQAEDDSQAGDALLELMASLEEAAMASEACVEQIETEYGALLDEKEEEIKAKMRERCPDVIEVLEEIDAGYE